MSIHTLYKNICTFLEEKNTECDVICLYIQYVSLLAVQCRDFDGPEKVC